MTKIAIISGSAFALLSVVMGAFGAHLLKDSLSDYSKTIYEKAVLYQMFHALGILILTMIQQNLNNVDLSVPIWLFILGIMLFSGSLYILALSEIKIVGFITPIGGTLFILGWLVTIIKVYKSSF